MNDLTGYVLGATDGEAGRILDLRVDPSHWTVQALVVDAGRPVLVSSRLLSGPMRRGGSSPRRSPGTRSRRARTRTPPGQRGARES